MAPSRKALYEDDRTWCWKFIVRLLAIVFAVVGIGCVGWAVGTTSVDSSDFYDYDFNGFVPWDLISLGLSVLWNIANISVLLSRNRPVVPGANVGCDLVLWLLLLATGILLVVSAQDDLSPWYYDGYNDYDYNNGYGSGYDYGYYGYPDFVGRYHRRGIVKAVGCGFTFVVMLFHFALFVSACRYTHQRRRARGTSQAAATIAREMVAEMTRNGRLTATHPPLESTHQQYPPPPQPFPPPASPMSPTQQPEPAAAGSAAAGWNDPERQVPPPQQSQEQLSYLVPTVQAPPRALSPAHIPPPSNSPGSNPKSGVYRLVPPGHDAQRSEAQQHPTLSPPVSPILAPQDPQGH